MSQQEGHDKGREIEQQVKGLLKDKAGGFGASLGMSNMSQELAQRKQELLDRILKDANYPEWLRRKQLKERLEAQAAQQTASLDEINRKIAELKLLEEEQSK